jgi:hypothetical protein
MSRQGICLVRAYALSRLNQKLLSKFLVLGVVNIAIGIVVIYDSYGRGELSICISARDRFVQGTPASCTDPQRSFRPFQDLSV